MKLCLPKPLALAIVAATLFGAGAVQAELPPISPATEVSLHKPLQTIFASGESRLSSAGERWLRQEVAKAAARPDRMVVVSISGDDAALQQKRARVIRERLAALGVPADRVYFEAG